MQHQRLGSLIPDLPLDRVYRSLNLNWTNSASCSGDGEDLDFVGGGFGCKKTGIRSYIRTCTTRYSPETVIYEFVALVDAFESDNYGLHLRVWDAAELVKARRSQNKALVGSRVVTNRRGV
jgi:hypothetical protein